MQNDKLLRPIVTYFMCFVHRNDKECVLTRRKQVPVKWYENKLIKFNSIENVYEVFRPHKPSLPWNSSRYHLVIEN
jgi:hypothetical protein